MTRSHTSAETLADLGEFAFLNEILLPLLNASGDVRIGDDTSSIDLAGTDRRLIVTSDVSPRPLVETLGKASPETDGWYSVLINASDLAVAGCIPLGFTSSVEAPDNTPVEELRRFFVGMKDACDSFGLQNAGGNLREAPRFECHGTAFGVMPNGVEPVSRRGAADGDILVSIGRLGLFITAYLKARRAGLDALSAEELRTLIRPQPKLREMQILVQQGFLSAASDNSDGLLGAIWNIAEKSSVRAVLDLDDDMLSTDLLQTAKREGLNPWNLAFCWGDWQVVATVPQDRYSRFVAATAAHGIDFVRLGAFEKGPQMICARYGDRLYSVNLVRNENFAAKSYNKGIQSQVDYQLSAPLFVAV